MEETARKVYGVGETIYDLIFKDDKPIAGHPGGSTFNCMISLGRCGVDGAFISETGKDQMGDLIIRFLEKNNLSGKYVNQFEGGKSALALAFLDENNDAVYDFYKDYPHQRLELELPELKKNDILVFGSFFALNEKVRPIVKRIIEQAYEAKAIIYYDPNYRSNHVQNRDILMATLIENFKLSSVIRASFEDFQNIYPGFPLDEVYTEISKYCPNLICTDSKNSVSLYTTSIKEKYNVPQIETISTVGAGDSFNAGFIFALIKNNVLFDDLPYLTKEIWTKLINTAISFSSEVCKSYENYISEEFARQFHL